MAGRTSSSSAKRFELGELFDHRNDVLAELAGENHHLDEFVVLEAVADDRRFVSVGEREDGEQFRFTAGFETEVVFLAEVENFLDDVALLVHLDGIDAAVPPVVFEFASGVVEGFGDLTDAVSKNIGEANQDGGGIFAVAKFVDELLEVDRFFGAFIGVDGDVPGFVDAEVALTPVFDAIGFERFRDFPNAGGFGIGATLQGFGHQCGSKSRIRVVRVAVLRGGVGPTAIEGKLVVYVNALSAAINLGVEENRILSERATCG
jgi:hypothetical protein